MLSNHRALNRASLVIPPSDFVRRVYVRMGVKDELTRVVRLGQPHMRGPKLLAIEKFINGRIGSPMVQHGGEAQYADHSEQSIDAFGPNGEDATILNEFSVRGWYETIFRGRKALG